MQKLALCLICTSFSHLQSSFLSSFKSVFVSLPQEKLSLISLRSLNPPILEHCPTLLHHTGVAQIQCKCVCVCSKINVISLSRPNTL
jgi:hypothetical protein